MQLYERQFQVPVCMYVHVYVHAARYDSSRARTDPQTLHIFFHAIGKSRAYVVTSPLLTVRIYVASEFAVNFLEGSRFLA